MSNIKPVIEAVQKAAYGHGAKAVAARLGHSVQYLSRICNPEPDPDEKRLLSLEAFAAILEETRDHTPLSVLAMMFGFRLVAVEAHPDKPTVAEELADDTQKLGGWAAACMNPKATEAEIRLAAAALHRDIEETEQAKLESLHSQNARQLS